MAGDRLVVMYLHIPNFMNELDNLKYGKGRVGA